MRPTSIAIAAAGATLLLLAPLGSDPVSKAAVQDQMFDDPLFRRCISWMLDGYKGAMLQNVCLEEYELPPPSLFLCARKIRKGFSSVSDREACAIVFEEQAKKARDGYVK